MEKLNKKVLCFIDESGTVGKDGFALGCVMVWARECGKVDKVFSSLLAPHTNEVHAAKMANYHIQSILEKFAGSDASKNLIMINKLADVRGSTQPEIYANALIETVKAGMKRFGQAQHNGKMLRNVEVMVDVNEQNTHPTFSKVIEVAQKHDGRFKGVTRVIPLDSAASRALQLADIVAYSRLWVIKDKLNSRGLSQAFNIELL